MAIPVSSGAEIEIEERGDHADPAFLLIRGLGTQLVQWPDEFLDVLVDAGFRVVTFDNRDVGLSQKFDSAGLPEVPAILSGAASPPYTLADMARDGIGVLDALEISLAHVAGISLGGMVAQHMASSHGSRCRTVTSIMSSSGAPGLPPPNPQAMEALTSRPENPDDRECAIQHLMKTQRWIESPDFALSDGELRRYFEVAYDRCYHPAGVARQMAAVLADGSRVERLQKIRVPALVIHGAEDPLVPLAAGEDTARHVPGARLEVIPGMGHDVTPKNGPLIARLLVEHARSHAGTG